MPRTVSTIGACCLGYVALNAYVRAGNALSLEAGLAHKAAHSVLLQAESSEVLFGQKANAISQLKQLTSRTAEEDISVNPIAARSAENFLRALPASAQVPEITVDPDGWISLDWIQSRNRLLTLSIGDSMQIAYAWLDGAEKGHAVANFNGQSVPSRILDQIQELTPDANTPLRIA